MSKRIYPLSWAHPDWSAAADYDGDGLADPAVYRPAMGDWIQKLSGGGYVAVTVQSMFGE